MIYTSTEAKGNDTTMNETTDTTLNETAAETTLNETAATAVSDDESEHELVIDESKIKKPKGKAKIEKAKVPETPTVKEESELTSRSGRKIKPKRYLDQADEPSLPSKRRVFNEMVFGNKTTEVKKVCK